MKYSRRIKLEGVTAIYHVISRTVRQQFWLGDDEKEMLVHMMRKQAAFSGVEILGYCIMDNHFHLMVRVRPCFTLSDELLIERYRTLYEDGYCPYSSPRADEFADVLREGGKSAQLWREKIIRRMGDLSVFVKELKQRFGIWYNDRHESKGTIWSDRFKSLLVEPSMQAMGNLWAYINLNPVRAGICKDPAQYRWCSYAAVMSGRPWGRDFLGYLYDRTYTAKMLHSCRLLLWGKESFQQKETADGSVPLTEALLCRARFFTAGTIIGSKLYIDDIAGKHAEKISLRRKSMSLSFFKEFFA